MIIIYREDSWECSVEEQSPQQNGHHGEACQQAMTDLCHPCAKNSLNLDQKWRIMFDLDFFQPCHIHCFEKKNECNIFCPECSAAGLHPMCRHCLMSHSCTGPMLQIRRYMYQNVVHVENMSKYCDLSGIQAYCINGKRAVLLHPKAGPASPKGMPVFDHSCAGCDVPLRPDCNFCSLYCKLGNLEGNKQPSTPRPIPKRQRSLTYSSDESCVIHVSAKKTCCSVLKSNTLRKRARKSTCPIRSLDM